MKREKSRDRENGVSAGDMTKESLLSAVLSPGGIWIRAAVIPRCLLYGPAVISAASTAKLWRWQELTGIPRTLKEGEIERDENGEPTGVLKENARNLVTPFMPPENREEAVENLTELGKLLTSQGIVAVTDMGNLDEGDNYLLYQEAVRKGFLQEVGVYYMWDFFMDKEDFQIPEEHFNKKQQIFVSGLKLIGDEAFQERPPGWQNLIWILIPVEFPYAVTVRWKLLLISVRKITVSFPCMLWERKPLKEW